MIDNDEVLNKIIGKVLQKDIVDHLGVLLIPKNTKITAEHVNKLIKRNILLSDEYFISLIEENYSHRHIIKESFEVSQLINNTKDIFTKIKVNEEVPLLEIRNSILPIIQSITSYSDLFKLFRAIQSKNDYDYDFHHAVGVAILAHVIGKWLNIKDHELNLLTLSAYLHDVGKLKIDKSILSKPGKLTDEEFEIVKKHTIYGYQLLKNTVGLSKKAAFVALQHHERIDGSGYPLKIKGEQMDLFSKIVAVCDTFHAMISNKVYRPSCYFHSVVSEIHGGIFGKFSPEIVLLLFNKISESLSNGAVILSDKKIASIVYVNQNNPLQPIIKVNDKLIDLSKEHNLYIVDIL